MTTNNRDLEQYIARGLERLPSPQAPPTLLPRVLRAVERRLHRPWYERSWFSWPRALQAASLGTLAGVVAGLALLEPAAQAAWSEILSSLGDPLGRAAGDLRSTLTAAGALRRALVDPVLGYLVVMGFIMGTACAGLGAALRRVTSLGGASES